MCIGMPFSMQEAVIILGNLLRSFRFDLVEGQRIAPQQRITLRPREGMKMHVQAARIDFTKREVESFFVTRR